MRLGSTWPVRDMNPVWDTVDGFLLAAEADGVEGEDFNVGSGEGRSIADIVALAGELVGRTPVVVAEDERVRPPASEVDRLVCDYGKAAARLGYAPRVPFAEGLRRVVDDLSASPAARAGYAR